MSEVDNSYKWYALYTRSRAEKKLHHLLVEKGIESFLPLRKTLKQSSDRKKWVEEPLMRSYLLVHVSEKEYFDVLNTPGAVRYVSFEGKAAEIPEAHVLALKNFIENKPEDITVEAGSLAPGETMEVIRGPLKGIKGEIIEIRGSHRLLLRFDTLNLCVHTEVELRDVKKGI